MPHALYPHPIDTLLAHEHLNNWIIDGQFYDMVLGFWTIWWCIYLSCKVIVSALVIMLTVFFINFYFWRHQVIGEFGLQNCVSTSIETLIFVLDTFDNWRSGSTNQNSFKNGIRLNINSSTQVIVLVFSWKKL